MLWAKFVEDLHIINFDKLFVVFTTVELKNSPFSFQVAINMKSNLQVKYFTNNIHSSMLQMHPGLSFYFLNLIYLRNPILTRGRPLKLIQIVQLMFFSAHHFSLLSPSLQIAILIFDNSFLVFFVFFFSQCILMKS